MKILSHRGLWETVEEKNSSLAFTRSFAAGFGLETDLRDLDGEIVVSHDPPRRGVLTLADFLKVPGNAGDVTLALNVKADGLASALAEQLSLEDRERSFFFDMSVPDMRFYLELGLRVFTRLSEVEREPAYLSQCSGIWLDSFGPEWYDASLVERLLESGKSVCVVSSELHGRDAGELWESLAPLFGHPSLMICTDDPIGLRARDGGR